MMHRQIATALLALCIAIPALADSARTGRSPFHLPVIDRESHLLSKRWEDLSDREKQRVREAKEKYERLPAERQENLRRKWEKMPEQEKDKYRLDNGKRERKSR
ncbi:MAG: DUF3106 domain-containing protein [Porticoccaceae bacterium]